MANDYIAQNWETLTFYTNKNTIKQTYIYVHTQIQATHVYKMLMTRHSKGLDVFMKNMSHRSSPDPILSKSRAVTLAALDI